MLVLWVYGLKCQRCDHDITIADMDRYHNGAHRFDKWPVPFTEELARSPLYHHECGGRLSILNAVYGTLDNRPTEVST